MVESSLVSRNEGDCLGMEEDWQCMVLLLYYKVGFSERGWMGEGRIGISVDILTRIQWVQDKR